MKPRIALIGPGKVGCAITKRLYENGYPIAAVIGRDLTRAIDASSFIGDNSCTASTELKSAAAADIILVAVPDDQIKNLAEELLCQVNLSDSQLLIHFSGLHSAEILRSPKTTAKTLSIHPLLPFANRQIASERLTGCPCALEGDDLAIPVGTDLINAFGGRPFQIAAKDKALYHASACIASNFLVTLLVTAADLLTSCGIETSDANRLLFPLVQATLNNVAQLGPQQGLTGPIVRGDLGTVAAHLSALNTEKPGLTPLYQCLGHQTIELATKSSRLSAEQAGPLLRLLNSGSQSTFSDSLPYKQRKNMMKSTPDIQI